jgi:hypothetical protein
MDDEEEQQKSASGKRHSISKGHHPVGENSHRKRTKRVALSVSLVAKRGNSALTKQNKIIIK